MAERAATAPADSMNHAAVLHTLDAMYPDDRDTRATGHVVDLIDGALMVLRDIPAAAVSETRRRLDGCEELPPGACAP